MQHYIIHQSPPTMQHYPILKLNKHMQNSLSTTITMKKKTTTKYKTTNNKNNHQYPSYTIKVPTIIWVCRYLSPAPILRSYLLSAQSYSTTQIRITTRSKVHPKKPKLFNITATYASILIEKCPIRQLCKIAARDVQPSRTVPWPARCNVHRPKAGNPLHLPA